MLTLTQSVHGMYCVQAADLSDKDAAIIRSVMRNYYTNSQDYIMREPSHAFLQCDSNGYMMIEFWTENVSDINAFVDYLNSRLTG